MPTSASQEKRPNEKIRITANFANSLLVGESITPANVTISCSNALTDANTLATIVSGYTVSGSSVIATVVSGVAGDVHTLTFGTGLTNFNLSYEAQVNIIITNSPASDTALMSLPDLKLLLGVEDSSDDALLQKLLVAASQYIRTRTGREFTLMPITEELQPMYGENCVRMQLTQYPVRKIDSIITKDENDVTITSTSNADDWDFLPEGFVWFMNENYRFEYWPGKNIITYRAGYPKIPEDLAEVCAGIVALSYRYIGKEGISEERIGNYAYKLASAKNLPGSVRKELADSKIEGVITRYRRHDIYYVGMG